MGRRAAVRGKKKSSMLFRVAVVLLLAAIGAVLLDMRLRPELRAVAQTRAQQLAGQLAAQSVAQRWGNRETVLWYRYSGRKEARLPP